MKLKQTFAVLLAAGALVLTACTPRGAASSSAAAPTATAAPQPTEAPADSENTAAEPTASKILIAYFTAAENSGVDAVAFGCPAMGSEVLEEMEFEPMFSACKSHLSGKKVALFGSYGWGDGEWMRSWEKDCDDAGINLVCESVICQEAPDGDTLEACRAMGKLLAE